MVLFPLVQDDAVARQKKALAPRLALDHEIPLPREDIGSTAPIGTDAGFRELNSAVDTLVGRTLQPSGELQARKRLVVRIACIKPHNGRTIGAALDMRINLPVSPALLIRRGYLVPVSQARAIGAVDFGSWQRIDGEFHHQRVDAEYRAEESD